MNSEQQKTRLLRSPLARFCNDTRVGQSIVEYAVLLGVVIAALVIMQVFVKRGFQGGLKDSADKMGEQFSASGTTIWQERESKNIDGSTDEGGDKQIITEETATTGKMTPFLPSGKTLADTEKTGTLGQNSYSYNKREGGVQEATTETQTDQAVNEKFKWADQVSVDTGTVSDFDIDTGVYKL